MGSSMKSRILLYFPTSRDDQLTKMGLQEWYANRELLLSGATSDVGRALLEKILRSFPNVKVYVLIRTWNKLPRDERLKNIFMSPRFERLRQQDPNAINRVKTVECNLVYEGLAITKQDKDLLQNVSVVLHAAQLDRYDRVFEFYKTLPRLQVVAVFSSVFESSEKQLASLDGPVALLRTPLVGPALSEPMPGFVDVLKGSTALMVGAGFALGNSKLQAEIIPIDLAVNTLIAVAWERAIAKNVKETVVYNAIPLECTWGELIQKGHRGNAKFTYPTFGLRGMTSSTFIYWVLVLLFEWLPSAFCDSLLGLIGAKKRLLDEHRRVRNALRSLESISSRSWSAEKDRVCLLQQRLTPEDRDAFPVVAEIDIESYVLCAAASARKHCVDQSNINLMRIFRLLFLLLIAGVLVSAFLTYRNHVTTKYQEL